MVHITLFAMLNLLYFYISTFRCVCAVPSMAVFCTSLISCFPVMLLMYFLNDFEMVPVVPIITGITFVVTFHMCCISIVMFLYFRSFSASFLSLFCLLKLQHLLAYMLLFHYHELWCPVYCWGWFCRFALVDSTICLLDLFLPVLVHAHTSVFVQFYLRFPTYVELYFSTHTIMSFYILFFCQYWACWYNAVYCVIKLLTKSAFVICFCLQYFFCITTTTTIIITPIPLHFRTTKGFMKMLRPFRGKSSVSCP